MLLRRSMMLMVTALVCGRAHAQAVTHPNLNAQLLVDAHWLQRTGVDP